MHGTLGIAVRGGRMGGFRRYLETVSSLLRVTATDQVASTAYTFFCDMSPQGSRAAWDGVTESVAVINVNPLVFSSAAADGTANIRSMCSNQNTWCIFSNGYP